MNRILISILLLIPITVFPQLYDSFSDGNFTSSPVWAGDTGDWTISTNSTSGTNASDSYTLQLNAQVAETGTKYLSSQYSGSWGTEQSWSFWMGRRSNSAASGSNQSIIWLWANESDLTSNTVDGYRIIFGSNGDDNIILEVVVDGVGTTIITSDSAVVSEADISFMIRVTRSSSSVWNLYSSTLPTTSGEGDASTSIPSATNTNLLQGNVTNSTYTNFDNGYLGFMATHTSGSTALDGAEFDQLYFDTDASSALPVELINFNAKPNNDKILLIWQTATEVNNFGFEVQRTNPPQSFGHPLPGGELKRWVNIGFINGHGNSNSDKFYSFIDENPKEGINYYRLKQIDFDGGCEYSKTIKIQFNRQADFKLEQNYPNPFNPVTKIAFTIPLSNAATYTTLKVYDILGNEIVSIINGVVNPGKHEVKFEGERFSSGVYYYVLTTENYQEAKKMLLIK